MEKKKDLRVQKTYSALMAAFEALMAEETFDDITVNELCARALIRRPTFYSHFEDKYGFLRFYLNEIQWQIESEADAATDLPVEHFQRSWRALIAFVDEHPALIRMGLRSKSLPIIFEIISEHVFASSSRRVRAYCGAVHGQPRTGRHAGDVHRRRAHPEPQALPDRAEPRPGRADSGDDHRL